MYISALLRSLKPTCSTTPFACPQVALHDRLHCIYTMLRSSCLRFGYEAQVGYWPSMASVGLKHCSHHLASQNSWQRFSCSCAGAFAQSLNESLVTDQLETLAELPPDSVQVTNVTYSSYALLSLPGAVINTSVSQPASVCGTVWDLPTAAWARLIPLSAMRCQDHQQQQSLGCSNRTSARLLL